MITLLIMIIWVLYGVLAGKIEIEHEKSNKDAEVSTYALFILFAPLILAIKLIKSIFEPLDL